MRHATLAAALFLAASVVTGCHIDTDKHGDGDNVKIDTPFGGMSVKTDTGDVLAGMGLPLYPGATPVKKGTINGKDNGSADVNMSFGSFQLKVKAAEYRTNDSPEQVFAFYKKALNRYGDVIQCSNDRPVGIPTRTREGLACDDDHYPGKPHDSNDSHSKGSHEGAAVFDGSAKVQLKAGSKKHQHIVDINPDSGGARFGLVSLDLPLDIRLGNDKDDQPEKPEKEEKQ